MQVNQIKKDLKDWKNLIKPYQQHDTKLAITQILNTFLPFLALWTVTFFAMDYAFWAGIPLAILCGFFMARIFIIQHDCGHQSFVKSRQWNSIIGWGCSIFSTIPYDYWYKVHNYHHSHNGQLENRHIGDVPMLTVKEYEALSWWRRLAYRIYRSPLVLHLVVPVGYILYVVRTPLVTEKSVKKGHRTLFNNNILILLIYLSLTFLLGWNFLITQLTILFFFIVIAFWFFYVQHQHEETYKEWKDRWDYLIASIKGSTYYKLPRPIQWLTGNIGLHHIHHLSPRIPNYFLVKCAKENPVFQKHVTILTFRDSLKCMFNKLWDEEQKKMISFWQYSKLKRNLSYTK
ncbi:fatty acid desaturase [Membranihabitans maritimus]|uniref:fatty acid desaturase n=1 Tax=Membranihabitans maritimus TaxID=2904244 RepID=UPI001F020C69|nr:fatty acid desaturase [Membranihabitans maritimus]